MKGTFGWMFTTWLALIALQTLSTKGASGRVASAFADVNGIVNRVLDADVPAIPDRRAGAAPSMSKYATKTGMTSTLAAPSPALTARSPLYSRLPIPTT